MATDDVNWVMGDEVAGQAASTSPAVSPSILEHGKAGVLPYRRPKPVFASRSAVRMATASVASIALILNVVLLMGAKNDGGWGALGIMKFYGPTANAVLIVVSLLFIPFVRAAAGAASITGYVLTSIVLPAGAIILDAFAISSMGLHGC